ncbi:MAG: type II toxin-antitoxin system Phd/YefM family antitoxin [Candidatus Latescibacteria bacterium]|nr:type II toxin-antitoxin system Phd/YefM family antitoxin [Candidatus Latescibacterota bacterium]
MLQVNIHEAKTHFSKLIKKVIDGEEIVIAKSNKPIAKIISINKPKPKRILGAAKGKIKISSDFDAPIEDFVDYIQ